MMVNDSHSAILYKQSLDFTEIFRRVGDSIRVFIPVDEIKNDAQPISQALVYGSRPYSVHSDILAMTVHMGILFPSEKKLSWSTSATCFHPEKENEKMKSEHVRVVNDEFGLLGVVITVVADPPLEQYNSLKRYTILSKEESCNHQFSLDIKKAFVATKFERPKIVDDFEKILTKYYIPSKPKGKGALPYVREYFNEQACKHLFQRYNLHIFSDDEFEFRIEGKPQDLRLIKINEQNAECLISSISLDDISFMESAVFFTGKGQISAESFSFLPKEGA